MTGTRGVGAAGLALAAAVLIGLTTTAPAGPVLTAATYYLEGTRIGDTTGHQSPYDFTVGMITGAGAVGLVSPLYEDFSEVDYPASIWPFSNGGLGDPTWNASVAQGKAALGQQPLAAGDTVVGFSQGAVVASSYKGDPLAVKGVNYVLIENPGRPNGGIMQRFNGLHIPLLDITFSGATPVRDPADGGGVTVDIARQYDGWADFPTYPLNLLATANAVLGIVYLHGDTQDLDASSVQGIDKTDPMYYQQHGDTTYYLIPTERLPLLMPFTGLVPEPVLDAVDPPLRRVVELGYDRTDYSEPTTAQLLPPLRLPRRAVDDTETPEVAARAFTAGEPAGEQARIAEQKSAERDASEPDAAENPRTRKAAPLSALRRAAASAAATVRSPFQKRPVAKTSVTRVSEPDKPARADKPDKPARAAA